MAKAKADKGSDDQSTYVLDIFDDSFVDDIESDSRLLAQEIGLNDLDTAISSGSLVLDLILGGGHKSGKVYAYTGPEHGGKTTIVKMAMGQALRTIPYRLKGVFLDGEGTFDPIWAGHIWGVEPNELHKVIGLRNAKTKDWLISPQIRYYKPQFGEQGLVFLTNLVKNRPEKVKLDNRWWYLYVPSTADEVRKNGSGWTKDTIRDTLTREVEVNGKTKKVKLWDASLYSDTGCFYVPVPNNYGGPELIIGIDSFTSLTPKQIALQDNEALGAQARMFSRYLTPLKSLIASRGITLLGTKQIRQKIGGYGDCFVYHTPVLLEDGTIRPIGLLYADLAKGKEVQRVMSYNFETDTFEPKRIVRAYRKATQDNDVFIKVTYDFVTYGHSGNASVTVTDNHNFFTTRGEVKVKDLRVGDYLLGYEEGYCLNEDQKQLLYGSLLGDGEINLAANHIVIQYNHIEETQDYLKWKKAMLGGYNTPIDKREYSTKAGERRVLVTGKTGHINNRYVPKSLRVLKRSQTGLNQKVIDRIDIRSMAIWFMDDGTLSSNTRDGYCLAILNTRWDLDTKRRLAEHVTNILGVSCTFDKKGFYINRKAEVISALSKLAPYCHKDFTYKFHKLIPSKAIGTYKWDTEEGKKKYKKVKVLGIEYVDPTEVKFDLEVEDNHNYIVGGRNGILVHNSEYNPGGETLKHVDDVRCRIGTVSNKIKTGKSNYNVQVEGDDEYRYFHIRNKKNKTFVPFKECDGRWWTQHGGSSGFGIDPVFDVLKYLEMTGQKTAVKKGFSVTLQEDSKAAERLKDIVFSYDSFKDSILEGCIYDAQGNVVSKKFNLREYCGKQLHRDGGYGLQLFLRDGDLGDEGDGDDEEDGEE